MPTVTIVAKYINSGTGKNGKPYHHIKTPDDDVFWSTHPIQGIEQGQTVTVDYTINKNGSKQLVKYGVEEPARGNGGLRAAPGKPAAIGGDKDRMIWLMNQTSVMIEAHGKVPTVTEYQSMIDLALRGFEYQKRKNNPQHADDMDDEIPDWEQEIKKSEEDYK